MNRTIGQRMRDIRESKGMTQKQVADKCGMADSAIRRYEAGGANPKLKTLLRIAGALGVSITDLLDVPDEYKISATKLERALSELDEKIKSSEDEEEVRQLRNVYDGAYGALNDEILPALIKEQAQKILSQTETRMEQREKDQHRSKNQKEAYALFSTLNERGQKSAIQHLKELAQIPDYQIKCRGEKSGVETP